MAEYTVTNLALQVEQMRNAQNLYFTFISKAKKSKTPEDFTAAGNVLKQSKLLEKSIDDTIIEILHRDGPGLSENLMLVDREVLEIANNFRVACKEAWDIVGGTWDDDPEITRNLEKLNSILSRPFIIEEHRAKESEVSNG